MSYFWRSLIIIPIILGGAAMWGLFYEFYEQDQILATYERTQGKIQLKINGGWKEGVVL